MKAKLKNANDIAMLKNQGFDPQQVADILSNRGIKSSAEVEKLLSMREGLFKRQETARRKRHEHAQADLNLINQLGPIVGSEGNRDITFAGWASTGPSAEAYIKSNKNMKDWSVREEDIDNDQIKEILLYDDEQNVRRVNGWGVKESLKPIRDDYFFNNPTVASRKNITQSEWTRAVQVDKDGGIGYMFPQAQRYKKSRQAYYENHKDKIPKPDIKQVWQKYVAKPFIHMIKTEFPDAFKGLNALPGMAAATLSQHFSMHGLTYTKLKLLRMGFQNNHHRATPLDELLKIVFSGVYGDEAYADLRKETNKMLKSDFEYTELKDTLRGTVFELADLINRTDSVGELIKNSAFKHLKDFFENTYNYILDEYAEEGRENVLKGIKRTKRLYLDGRGGVGGEMMDAIRNRQIEIVHHDKANDPNRPQYRDQVRRERAPAKAAVFDNMLQKAGIDPGDYKFYQAFEEWYEDHRRVPFDEFMAMKIAQAKNQ